MQVQKASSVRGLQTRRRLAWTCKAPCTKRLLGEAPHQVRQTCERFKRMLQVGGKCILLGGTLRIQRAVLELQG